MKRRYMFLILILLSLFLIGCTKDHHPINMEIAKPYHDDEELGVKYYYTLGIGAYEGKRYSLMGTHDSKMAFVIRNVERSRISNHIIVHLWMNNISNSPITFGLDGFQIHSPDNKIFSIDNDYQLDRAVRVDGVEYGYITLQPDQQKQTFLYFNIPRINTDDLGGWRFGYNSSHYLSVTGFLKSILRSKNYVWLYPAYKAEIISK